MTELIEGKSDRPGVGLLSGFWNKPTLSVMLALALVAGAVGAPLRLVVIGDSLSAEYDSITGLPGMDDPTEYAAISVDGWESMSWVEVLGRLRSSAFDLGQFKDTLPGWSSTTGDLRFTGYEFNFAIPGFTAAQFRQVVNSSFLSHPEYLLYKGELASALQTQADAAVVWLGGNEFRANYGSLYDGANPVPLINNLSNDLAQVIDFVRAQNPGIKLVVANLPDLGATPTKQADHPDPLKRANVTAATIAANEAIAALAAACGLPVADIFPDTYRLVVNETVWIGPVNLFPGSEPDNHPRYQFTRDGLHPNTCLQSIIARRVVETFNQAYSSGVSPITDGEILSLIGVPSNQTYLDWVAAHSLSAGGAGDDGDADDLVNLAEFVFDLDPANSDAGPVTIDGTGSPTVVRYQTNPDRERLVAVEADWSTTLSDWIPVPPENIAALPTGEVTITLPVGDPSRFVRFRVFQKPVP